MTYHIKDGYVSRWPVRAHDPFFFPDDDYQRPVYERALIEFERTKAKLLVDLGCGTGRKLAEFFPPSAAIGVELMSVIPEIRRELGDRWRLWGPGVWPRKQMVCDILLCADVIEHVEQPAQFLSDALALYRPKLVVLSTPAREHITGGSLTGPPTNPCHAREWTMREFAAFCGEFLRVDDHALVDQRRATQMIVGVPL